MYTRLGVSNAMAAVLAALRAGILSLTTPPTTDH